MKKTITVTWQVPNLTLNPGAEAVIDVEVDASPPARFDTLSFIRKREGDPRERERERQRETEERRRTTSQNVDFCRFTWFVNGYEFRESAGKVHIYYPKENRCVARFPMPGETN